MALRSGPIAQILFPLKSETMKVPSTRISMPSSAVKWD